MTEETHKFSSLFALNWRETYWYILRKEQVAANMKVFSYIIQLQRQVILSWTEAGKVTNSRFN